MKNLILVVAAGLMFTSCQTQQREESTVSTGDTLTENSSTVTTTTTTTYSTPMEGDVKMGTSKVMVYRNGDWQTATTDVTLADGSVVSPDGEVEKNGNKKQLTEGEVVNSSGNFFDRTGNAISDAWEATKEGAKDAWDATKKGAEKVGDKTQEVIDDIKD